MFEGQLPLFNKDKRWKDGRQRFVVPPHVFDPRDFHVAPVATKDAREFTLTHHYAQSWVASRFCFGMYRRKELVGVAVFSVPMSPNVVKHYLRVSPEAGVELGRLCLLTEIGFNAETWFLARAFAQLRAADSHLKGVISFADPLERTDSSGIVQKPQHFGTIYRASNATFAGRSSARWLHVLPNGNTVTARTLSKVRNDEQGRNYASDLLVRSGLPKRKPFESGAAWLNRIEPHFRRIRHSGNLAFTFMF